jgi:hypothetical protein
MAGMIAPHTGFLRALGLEASVTPGSEIGVVGGIASLPELRLF